MEQSLTTMKEKIPAVAGEGDLLLVIPPFGSIDDITVGPLSLRAVAVAAGYKVDVLYLNMLLAAVIGAEQYQKIQEAPLFWMLGERLLAAAAYDLPRLGQNPGYCADERLCITGRKDDVKMFYYGHQDYDEEHCLEMEKICRSFIAEAAGIIAALDYKIMGCTTSIAGQTNASVALLNEIKKLRPDITTIIGGSNCDGEKAEGIASLSTAIDYIFSGESENSLLAFLKEAKDKKFPAQRVIRGEPVKDTDTLPLPDYDICLRQAALFLGESQREKTRIWYESSRGCWWAQKSKCTFCGVLKRTYRHKSVAKLTADMKQLHELFPQHMLFMADDIMPPSYQKELLPVITGREEFPQLAYQLKADLQLNDLLKFKAAKINAILPGIESFSTNMLKLMNKGSAITAAQNLLLLRNARSVGMYCDWFLLWGVPGDTIEDYRELLAILPLIRHLQPPRRFQSIMLIPFSPFFENTQEYHIADVRPWAVFNMIYPAGADIAKLANFYIGDYSSGGREHPEMITAIADEISTWNNKWEKAKLHMNEFMGHYAIHDKRDLWPQDKKHLLEFARAKEIMTGCVYNESENLQWAVAEKLGIVVDSRYVPLVTAAPGLLQKFEETC